AQVITLAPRQPWVRRANLLETLNAFFRIERRGKYEVLARGVEARLRIEPFFTSFPPNYAPPEMRGSGSVWDLDAGYYVLTAEPVRKGIVDLAVQRAGEGDPFARAGPGGSARRTAAQFPEFKVRHDRVYTVYLNRQPEVRAGLVLRPLPLDLREALPVTQRPGETVSVRFRVKEEGTLRAEAEDGTALAIAVAGGPAIPSPARPRTASGGTSSSSSISARATTRSRSRRREAPRGTSASRSSAPSWSTAARSPRAARRAARSPQARRSRTTSRSPRPATTACAPSARAPPSAAGSRTTPAGRSSRPT